MSEEKGLITSELSVTFAPDGTIGSGGGLHIKLIIPGTPTVETIQGLIDRVREAALNGITESEVEEPEGWTPPGRGGRVVLHTPERKPEVEVPRCPRKGVQVTKKGGKYKPGFYPNWHHNEPRQGPNGNWFCPTVVGVDADGETIWCDWVPVAPKGTG